VEVENTLASATQPAASGLIIEAEGLRLLLECPRFWGGRDGLSVSTASL